MGDCVTMPWLIATAIAICTIIIPTIILWSRGKVNKETCNVVHHNVDKNLSKICTNVDEVSKKLDGLLTTVVRIETTLSTTIKKSQSTSTGASGR